MHLLLTVPPCRRCRRSVWWREVFPKFSEGEKKTLYMKIWAKIRAGKLELDKNGRPAK